MNKFKATLKAFKIFDYIRHSCIQRLGPYVQCLKHVSIDNKINHNTKSSTLPQKKILWIKLRCNNNQCKGLK